MTYADSALIRALGKSRNRPTAVTPPPTHYLVLATDLKVGDQIRDRGELHTIDELHRDDHFRSLTVVMEDGGRLAMPLHQHVTVWLPTEATHA